MAYGNWGAWVFCNSEHMPNWEDQTPYKENELMPGYQQVAWRKNQATNPCHAVLGKQNVRLCGYKNYPMLFVDGEKVDIDAYCVSDDDGDFDERYEGELNGYQFIAQQFDLNMIDLKLIEPDGSIWQSRCGYCYGAGYDDAPVNDCEL